MHTHNAHLPWCEKQEACLCESKRYVYASSICLVIIVVQIIGWSLSGSLALLGDTGHVSVDFLGLMVAAAISWRATKQKDQERSIRMGGLAAQITLLGVVVGWMMIEVFERLHNPIDVIPMPLMIAASIGLLLNALQLWMLHPQIKNVTMHAARLHVLQDLLSSIGVVASGAIIWLSGWQYVDPVISALIAAWLLHQIVSLMRGEHHHH